MRLSRRLCALATASGLAAFGAAVGPATHVLAGPPGAPSGYCNDNIGAEKEIPLITSPVVLAVEVGTGGSLLNPHVGLCYSTTPEGSTGGETAGGAVGFYLLGNGQQNDVYSSSDPGAALQANATALTTPTWSLTPGPSGTTGDFLTVTVPFTICAGLCGSGSPTLNSTGLLIGQITRPEAPGGVNQAYQLSSVCVEVDGIALTNCNSVFLGTMGATTTGTSPINVEKGGPCGPGFCLPLFDDSYIGTSGDQLATIYLPFFPNGIPVYGYHTCLYHTPSTNTCPN